MKNKLQELYTRAGFSNEAEGKWPTTLSIGAPLENLVKLVIDECATVANLHSRCFSDGDAGIGALGAADAVRNYGTNLFDKKL